MAVTMRLVVFWVFFGTVFSDQENVLFRLVQKVETLEDEVTSLDARLEKLEAESAGGAKKELKLDLKIVNVTEELDEVHSLFNFTIHYEAEEQAVFLLYSHDLPTEIVHANRTVQFSVPSTDVSPVLSVYRNTNPDLTYLLVLIAGGGPPPSPNISNIALTTFPEHSIAFSDGDEPELTLTSRIVGNRRVREEAVSYVVISFGNEKVTYLPFGELEEEKNDVGPAGDVTSDDNVMGGPHAEDAPKPRLRLVEHSKKGDNSTYRLKLNTSFEDRGVLLLLHRVAFDCTRGCVLYETTVSKMIRFYNEDMYDVSDGLSVPYPKGSEAGHYLSFFSVGPQDNTGNLMVACDLGQPCTLDCYFFGDSPRVYFQTGDSPATIDQPRLQDYRDFGGQVFISPPASSHYLAYTSLLFESVPLEAAGVYACHAESASGLSTQVQLITLNII
ncbi:uncharacterized protein [Littorina saxatilis]|uniref:uncharacterized protein n=1 Tax=Littorina saxatilis TaxID=31220 RepID=UPI0038B5CD40